MLLLLGLPPWLGSAPVHVPAPATSSSPDPVSKPVAVPGDDLTATPSPHPPRSEPVHLDIPRIGLSTDVIPVGLNSDGTVGVPPLDDGAPAGWYRYLAPPGDPGPAVLLGHVDTHRGPAVFSRLHELLPGDAISVRRADGRTVDFVVDSVRTHPKAEFPAEAVYGPSAEPVLRLVTCGGVFDEERRSYRSNVVVYASFVAPVSGAAGVRTA
ncbi:class F sortase [Geodermatophilus dictyosporus]|uniref:class F sortase n=1 Tax=Geodermatophilus dictyosporus TaxID=1523247 RepID=UPI00145C22C2|nr:class F sortase [Geodermatophilus dictyosporus]